MLFSSKQVALLTILRHIQPSRYKEYLQFAQAMSVSHYGKREEITQKDF